MTALLFLESAPAVDLPYTSGFSSGRGESFPSTDNKKQCRSRHSRFGMFASEITTANGMRTFGLETSSFHIASPPCMAALHLAFAYLRFSMHVVAARRGIKRRAGIHAARKGAWSIRH